MNGKMNEGSPRPRMITHADHAEIEPVRDLADRAVRPGSQLDVQRLLAAADAALDEIRSEFPAWMANEFRELQRAWALHKANDPAAEGLLYRKLHDIRGQAATFGYPLAGRAADILCKLIDAVGEAPEPIVDAHIHAIKAILRDDVKTDDHPVGLPMIAALEILSHKLVQETLKPSEG